MTPEKTETAEQKLLKMIESQGAGANDSGESKSARQAQRKQSFLSFIQQANKVLVVAVIVAALFFGYEIIDGMSALSQNIKVSYSGAETQEAVLPQSLVPPSPRLASYLSEVKRRDIFAPYDGAGKINETDEKNRRIVQDTRNYRLVGIAWFDTVDSASVMIEDTEQKVTRFLQKGEMLGNIVIKTIYADSAVLGYPNEDEEIIIRYDKPKM